MDEILEFSRYNMSFKFINPAAKAGKMGEKHHVRTCGVVKSHLHSNKFSKQRFNFLVVNLMCYFKTCAKTPSAIKPRYLILLLGQRCFVFPVWLTSCDLLTSAKSFSQKKKILVQNLPYKEFQVFLCVFLFSWIFTVKLYIKF